MWKSFSFPKWLGNKYFEQSSKNVWLEVTDNSVKSEYQLVSAVGAQVILQKSDRAHFVKLVPGMAWYGKAVDNFTNVFEHGNWECKCVFNNSIVE